jgi:hypothetical protein
VEPILLFEVEEGLHGRIQLKELLQEEGDS